MKKILKWAGIVVLILLVGIQLVPVDRTNPAVTREVHWDSLETKALAQRACYDCHSNETTWPWYSYIAPISLRVAGHVTEGRRALNFSAWDQPNEDIHEIEEVLERGEMPLRDYLLMHPEAKLSEEETAQLLAGLQATYAQDPPVERPAGPRR